MQVWLGSPSLGHEKLGIAGHTLFPCSLLIPVVPFPLLHLPCSFQEFQTFLVAILAGTLFLYTNMHTETINDGLVYLGLLFFCSMTAMWNVFAEMGTMVREGTMVFVWGALLCRGRAYAASSAT